MDIRDYLKKKKDLVDSFLEEYFREKTRPQILSESMFYSLSAGGKRIRPVLCLSSYEACGGRPEDIIQYASALEMIHTYSLIHDDLPAMDNDDLRRGKPTNHKVYGEAIAILAGDALLTEAFSILSIPHQPVSGEALLKAIREIAVASGMGGMVAGQVQDMLSENSGPDEETLKFIHLHKTAALLSSSVRTGAILSGVDDERFSAISEYGHKIGLAFQVIDDILDIEGDTEVIGKPKGSDEKKKKLTYPRIYGLAKSRSIAEQLIKDAVGSLSIFSSEADPLREIALYLLNRNN
jgi:geranylgeranyl diphosphate synthase type II